MEHDAVQTSYKVKSQSALRAAATLKVVLEVRSNGFWNFSEGATVQSDVELIQNHWVFQSVEKCKDVSRVSGQREPPHTSWVGRGVSIDKV